MEQVNILLYQFDRFRLSSVYLFRTKQFPMAYD